MIRALKTIVFAAVFSLTQWGCSFSPFNASGGSGADVETRVRGAVVDSSGKPVAGASVFLRPGGYVFPIRDLSDGDPGTRVDAITDHAGKYLIDSIGSGSYVIEINNRNGLAVAVRFATPDNGGTADLGVSTFERTGAIFGTIPAEARAGKQWFVQVYGLERIATADFASGTYSFSDIPAGRYYLRLITPSPGFKPIDSCSVTVPSGTTAVAPTYPVWRYGRTLTLNTTAAGAGVSGDVVHFPLLVRLTSKIFDFAQAEADGGDLRFTKANGVPLPYEIEQWDVANKRATVWVAMDTIQGNSGSQQIVMLWGNPGAAAQSYPSAPFDTSAGFQGVWHLGEPSGGRVADATANNNTGTAKATSTVSGAIGMAQSFDGVSSLIRASGPGIAGLNFPENGSYSISAWVNATVVNNLYHGIVYKSNFQYGLQIRPENVWEFFTFVEGTGWEGSRSAATTDSWHLISGIRRGNQQYLYVDGVGIDSTKTVVDWNLSRVEDSTLEIGHCPDGGSQPDRFFSGSIDEVRISNRADSPDWIKLCFMNQKVRDALVQW